MKIEDMGKHIIQNLPNIRQTNVQQNAEIAKPGQSSPPQQEILVHSIEAEQEFAPRTDLIHTVSERVAAGSYQRELVADVAGKVSEAPAVRAIMDEIGAIRTANRAPAAAESVKAKLQDGYYRTSGIMQSAAERMLGGMGIKE